MVAPAIKDEQSFGEDGYVLGTLSQRRNFDLDHGQPVKEVFSKSSFFDGRLQVDVGRRDNADIGLARQAVPDALIFFVLNETQQFRLKGKRQIADFVEEKRASLASGDSAGMVTNGARERPLGMPEQLAFQEF